MRRPLSARASATRQRILDAALAEFAVHGLAGARVDEIATRSGANKRMLYAHFGSKQALWRTVLDGAHAARCAAEAALDVAHLAPAEAMARLVRFDLRYGAAHPAFVALRAQENTHRAACPTRGAEATATSSPLLESLRAVLRRGEQAGLFRRDVDPRRLYVTISGLGRAWLANRDRFSGSPGDDPDPEDALAARERHVVEVVLGYLRP